MTPEQTEAIRQLRSQGFAVIIWHPEELEGANPRQVEGRSIELGHEVIEDLKEL